MMTTRWPDDEGPAEEEEEELEGEWELDPNDPTHTDYDLSDAHGYGNWEPPGTPLLARQTIVLVIVLLVVAALILIPLLQII
jgi:hypothetical protein